jgi:orotidine-5'-phosphate decarboxylase
MNKIDALIERIDKLGNPTVVGLDPTIELVPKPLMARHIDEYGKTLRAVAAAFFACNKYIIDAIADIVPAVKPQVAMYERLGVDGLAAYKSTCEYAASKGLIVIGDVKRGDISSTAAAYAAHLTGVDFLDEHFDPWREDFITVNPYLGSDGIAPFTEACAQTGKGIFVLVKTSNPSSAEIQDIEIEEAPADLVLREKSVVGDIARTFMGIRPMPLYEQVARYVNLWGRELVGEYGYSSVGAVVGATHREIGTALRKAFPQMFFLVPGYGAQGAGAEDVKEFFDNDGRGCVVNSSRGIIGAWTNDPEGADGAAGLNESKAAELLANTAGAAARRMRDELHGVL